MLVGCNCSNRKLKNILEKFGRRFFLLISGGKYFGQNSLFIPSPSPYFFPVF